MYPGEDERETSVGRGAARRFDINDIAPTGPRNKAVAPEEDERETEWSKRGDGEAPRSAGGEERETKVHKPLTEPFEAVAWAYCSKGLRKGELFQFKKARTEFGRATDCDFPIEDDYASAHHGAVLFDSGSWRVFDFASSNGTFANGKRLGSETANPAELNDGDTITIGDTDFVFKRI